MCGGADGGVAVKLNELQRTVGVFVRACVCVFVGGWADAEHKYGGWWGEREGQRVGR